MQNKTPLSSEWIERSKHVLAQGHVGTNSKRWTQYVQNVMPSHTNGHGSGCYLYDLNEKRYVDFPSALGALSLGYSNAAVIEAVTRQVRKGCSFTLPTTLEVETGEHLTSVVPAAERIRFLKTGSEATLAAIRIARTYTNRTKVLSRGYHGHADFWCSLTPPALGVKDHFELALLPEDVDQIENPTEIACIIIEAAELELSSEWQKKVERLRLFTEKHGIVFILDEIITGFRVPDWTVSKLYRMTPDLICLGKGIANGYPLSVVAGKKELMNAAEYFISSTFSGEAVSLAACKATMEEIETKKNLKDLYYYGNRLQDRLNTLHPEIRFSGYGTRAMLNVTNATTALFMQEMSKAGYLFGKAHFFHFGHLEANLEEMVMNAADAVLHQIKTGKVKMEGIPPEEVFVRK